MPVQRYRKDPRELADRRADEEVLQLFERGKFIALDATTEREANVQGRFQARREAVASLGKELGVLRRAHGLTQEQVALALGTKKSNVSRLESGQYGGITIEYFMAVLDAFRALGAGATRARARRGEVVPIKKAPSNKALHPTRPSRALASRG